MKKSRKKSTIKEIEELIDFLGIYESKPRLMKLIRQYGRDKDRKAYDRGLNALHYIEEGCLRDID